MLVLERRRDIAILKSSGASPTLIGSIFVLTGLAIGGGGTADRDAGSAHLGLANQRYVSGSQVRHECSLAPPGRSRAPRPRAHTPPRSRLLSREDTGERHPGEMASVAGAQPRCSASSLPSSRPVGHRACRRSRYSARLAESRPPLGFFFSPNGCIVLRISIACLGRPAFSRGGTMVKKEAAQAGAAPIEMEEKLKALEPPASRSRSSSARARS